MAALHRENWGKLSAEMMQNLLDDLLAGTTDALSVFMEDEKKLFLNDVPALVLLAAPSA